MLHKYQKKMVQHVLDHDRCALFAEMGLGKTLVTLEAIKDLPKPVLIVAPLRVVENVWWSEARKWNYDYSFESILGTPKQRETAAKANADIHLINIDNLVWLRKLYADEWKWPTIVFDESSLLKTPGSKRSRAALVVSRRASNVILLSGTPAPNGLQDVWHQIKILDGGERLGSNKSKFLRKNFYPENPYFAHTKWLIQDGKEKVITDKISDICLSLQARDYLNMPEKIINDIKVKLPTGTAVAYETLCEEMFLELEQTDVDPGSAGVLVGKLAQLASGAIYLSENGDGAFETIHEAKMKALADIIEEAAGQPVLIAYQYKHTLARLRSWFKVTEVRDTDMTIRLWNKNKIPLMAVQPASAGHGLNLQEGGAHILVWFDACWNLELYEQTNARLHRQGQVHPVIIHRLIASGTIDENIMEALEHKRSVQQLLMGALK